MYQIGLWNLKNKELEEDSTLKIRSKIFNINMILFLIANSFLKSYQRSWYQAMSHDNSDGKVTDYGRGSNPGRMIKSFFRHYIPSSRSGKYFSEVKRQLYIADHPSSALAYSN